MTRRWTLNKHEKEVKVEAKNLPSQLKSCSSVFRFAGKFCLKPLKLLGNIYESADGIFRWFGFSLRSDKLLLAFLHSVDCGKTEIYRAGRESRPPQLTMLDYLGHCFVMHLTRKINMRSLIELSLSTSDIFNLKIFVFLFPVMA